MSKNEVFDKIFNKLYQIKDNYGVDKQAEYYDVITEMIKRGFKSKSGPINMKNQKVEWTNKTNLAVYKEGLGVIPIDNLSSLEKSEGKRIPLENFNADFFEYYFIMTKTNPNNPLNGKPGLDKFRLLERSNKYILEIDTGDEPSETNDNPEIERKKKKLDLLNNKLKLEQEIDTALAPFKQQFQGIQSPRDCVEGQQECTLQLNKLTQELKKAQTQASGGNSKEIESIQSNIETYKGYLNQLSQLKSDMEKAEKKVKTEFKVKQLTDELKNLDKKTKARADSKGFNIQDKEIDGKKYISFSVKEYLERMIPELQ